MKCSLTLTRGIERNNGVSSLVVRYKSPVLLLNDSTLPLGAHDDLVPEKATQTIVHQDSLTL